MGDLRSVYGAARLLEGGWFRPACVPRAAFVGLLVSFLLVLTACARDAASAGLAPGAFPYGVPDRKPPLEGLLLSRDGRLWVLLAPPEGAPERTADLWSPEGTRIARVSWPAAVRAGLLGWADGWSLYGIHRDAFGVERAARVAFRER